MEDADPKERLLARLLAAHRESFDIEAPYTYAGRAFDAYAAFHSHGEKYVLTRRAKLWEVDAHEHMFFVLVDVLGTAALEDLVNFMKSDAVELVDARPNHMVTNLSLVVIANRVEPAACKALRKVRYRKNFKATLWGWADVRIAAVDLERKAVFSNAMGKQLVKPILANMELDK